MSKKSGGDKAGDFLDGERPDYEAEVYALRKQVSALQRKVRNQEGATAMVVTAMEDIFEGSPAPGAPRLPRTTDKKRREVAVLHLSDWQVGAVTEDFDTEIARHRVHEVLMPKVRRILDGRRRSASLEEIVVLWGGDNVDGSALRSNHPWEVDSTVQKQALESLPRIAGGVVLSLMEDFRLVRNYAVRGNHGRSGPFRGDPNPRAVNWDTVAARVTEMALGDAVDGERCTFEVEVERFYKIIEVGDKRILLIHGDQFRGGGGFAGIPYYKISQKMAKWASSIKEPWDVLMFGHYHTPASGMFGDQSWYLNGTLETGSPYALEELALSSRPAQRLLIFDPKVGPIADHVIWCDE